MTENDRQQIAFLREHIVSPMLEALEAKVKPIVDAAAAHEARITKLEQNQRKALTGYTAFVAVVSSGLAIGAGSVKAWFTKKVKGQ